MAEPELPEGAFAVRVDFEKNTGNPRRIFEAADRLIASFENIDADFVSLIDPSIQSRLVLSDVTSGSIRIWLAQKLEATDEQAFKELSWRKVVGPLVLDARNKYIDWANRTGKKPSRKLLLEAKSDLDDLAASSDVRGLPGYGNTSVKQVADHLVSLSQAKAPLLSGDALYVETRRESIRFNPIRVLPSDFFDKVLIKESIPDDNTMILKVKKPDFLGLSQWEFRLGNKPILAKVSHEDWLHDYQNRREAVRPGDSIRAVVKVTTQYGYDNEIVDTKYEVIEVLEVDHAPVQGRMAEL